MKRQIITCILLFIFTGIAFSQGRRITSEPEEIIDLHGKRLNNMFETFGNPDNLNGYSDGGVMVHYEDFGFHIKDKLIRMCCFFEEYDLPVNGVKLGETKASLINTLGKPDKIADDKDGKIIYLAYNIPGKDAYYVYCVNMGSEVLYKINIEFK